MCGNNMFMCSNYARCAETHEQVWELYKYMCGKELYSNTFVGAINSHVWELRLYMWEGVTCVGTKFTCVGTLFACVGTKNTCVETTVHPIV